MPIDQYSDPGFRFLNRIIQSTNAYDPFVKTASVDDDANEARPSAGFAWPEARLFPIDSPQEAAISKIYMEKQAGIPEEVIDRCNKALDIFGVEIPMVKEAAAEEDPNVYLLPQMKRFRVTSQESVKLAEDAINEHADKMGVELRTQASVNLVKKAAQHNVQLSQKTLAHAGMTMSDTTKLSDWLEVRAYKAGDESVSQAFQKLSSHVRTMKPLCDDRSSLVKVAQVIGELDQACGLDRFYGRTLPDPLDTVFNTNKIAGELLDVAGKQVPIDQLLSIPPDVYKDVFGEDLAAEFLRADGTIDPEQLKVILPTVPRDLQKVLTSQMGI